MNDLMRLLKIFQNVHGQVSFEVSKSRHHKTLDVKYLVAEKISSYIYICLSEEDLYNRTSRIFHEIY